MTEQRTIRDQLLDELRATLVTARRWHDSTDPDTAHTTAQWVSHALVQAIDAIEDHDE